MRKCLFVVFCCCTFFFAAFFSKVFPLIFGAYSFSPFSCSHVFLIFPFWILMLHMFFFGFCNNHVSRFPRWFPNDQWFFQCPKASHFPLYFCFF